MIVSTWLFFVGRKQHAPGPDPLGQRGPTRRGSCPVSEIRFIITARFRRG
jgi:hypothetical protein